MNLEKIRNDTPGLAGKLFMNSAGASLSPSPVVDKVLDYLSREALEGGYGLGASSQDEIDGFYRESARLLGCQPRNIAFAFNATGAYNSALASIPFVKGDVILTTTDDYVANQLSFLSMRDRIGIRIVRCGNLPNGDLDLDRFRALLKEHQPRLVSVTHIPTSSGKVQPVAEVGQMCREQDTLFLLDACQTLGQKALNVQDFPCDFLCGTGRKFLRGPRGTGLLYISDRVLERGMAPLYIDAGAADWIEADSYELHGDGRRFEIWERNIANMLGLAEAIRYANDLGMDQIEARGFSLAKRLRDGLRSIHGLRVMDEGTELGNIVTFYPEASSLAEFSQKLNQHQVYHSVSGIGAARIDFTEKGTEGAIRYSPHYFNAEEEIDQVLEISSLLARP